MQKKIIFTFSPYGTVKKCIGNIEADKERLHDFSAMRLKKCQLLEILL